jgi:hypothetical protein
MAKYIYFNNQPRKKEKITFFLRNKENKLGGFLDGCLSKSKRNFSVKTQNGSEKIVPFINDFLIKNYQNFKTINRKISSTNSIKTEE